jgi:predicted nucleic acid-binding protein
MTALFTDTFYWIALADVADSAHRLALALTGDRASAHIVTTDEVLTEYLTFFATAPEHFRRQAAESEVLTNDRHFEQEGFRALFRDS